jgi:hypothetical protein
MPQVERVREELSGSLPPELVREKASAGWRPVAVVWERELEEGAAGRYQREVDVPYGMRVAADGLHLEEHPEEHEVLLITMEEIVQDRPLSQVADALNGRGFRTRAGFRWNPASVFEILPRLIEAGPRLFSTEEWRVRRKHLTQTIQS